MRALRGLRTIAMAVVFLLFTGIGVALLFTGEGDDRVVGLTCVLLFGLGGAAYLASRRRKAGVALRVDSLTWDGQAVRALAVPVRRAKWLTMLLGAFGMGTACLLMGVVAPTFTDPGESVAFTQLIGYGGAAFFLSIGVAALLTVRHGLPRLALLPQGVAMIGGVAAAFIPWDAVADVGRFDMSIRGTRQRYAAIRATDPAAVRRRASSKALLAANRALSGWDLTFPESLHDVGVDELVMLLDAFWQRPELRRLAEDLPDGPMDFEEFARAHLDGHAAAPSSGVPDTPGVSG